MPAFSKKSIDKYIRNRMMGWIANLGYDAPKYLINELEIKLDDEGKPDDESQTRIRNFQRAVRDDIIVTGGCIASMLLGEEPNDIDIYIRTRETAELIARFYLNKMIETGKLKETGYVRQLDVRHGDDGIAILIRSQGITGADIDTEKYRYFEMYPEEATDEFFKEYRRAAKKIINDDTKKFVVTFLTANAITLNNGLQIIVRFCGEPEEIHKNFDFVHATNYWTWNDGVVYNEAALIAVLEKRLRYVGSLFPVASIFRLKKFVERGWRISAGEMVKIMYDISKLDLDDPQVLKHQSMGMDSAYFCDVVAKLRNRDEGDVIDRTYLFNVINEVFEMHDSKDRFLEDSTLDEETVDLEERKTYKMVNPLENQ